MGIYSLVGAQTALTPLMASLGTMDIGLSSVLGDPAQSYFQPGESALVQLEAGIPRATCINGGGMPGGGSANPRRALEEIFPHGAMPTDAHVISRVVEEHSLLASLQQGLVYVLIQKVPGSSMPRIDTLSALPVNARQAYQAMLDLNDWSQWMPRNIFSRGTPTGRPNEQFHEAKVDGGAGGTFHYRALLENRDVPGGHQVSWTINERSRIEPDRRLKGLRINDGSWTFTEAPGHEDETLMAYQIHIEALVKGGWVGKQALRLLEPIITRITLGEFDQVVGAMANHASDPSWTGRSGTNPSGRDYTIKKV